MALGLAEGGAGIKAIAHSPAHTHTHKWAVCRLTEYTADVCLLQRNVDDHSVRDQIRALGRRAEIVYLDVTDQASVRAVIDRVLEIFPTIDILVNNAGIQRRYP